MTTHIQVSLVKNNVHYTCWIPSKNIKIGSIIELQETDHQGNKYFDPGWKVVGVGQKVSSEFIQARERDHLDFKARIK